MTAIDSLKDLLQSPLPAMPDQGEFVYVYLPYIIEPEERCQRYQEPLDDELRLRGAGWISGGTSLLPRDIRKGTRPVAHVGVYVKAVDIPRTREIFRTLLPSLGAPVGTRIEYMEGYEPLADEYDGARWALALEYPDDDDDWDDDED